MGEEGEGSEILPLELAISGVKAFGGSRHRQGIRHGSAPKAESE